MVKRAERIINAFIKCVAEGTFSFSYAVTLIEDQSKYGYLTDEEKEVFYTSLTLSE